MLQIGAAIEEAGYSVKIIDYNVTPFKKDELQDIVRKDTPLFIGLTMLAIHTPAIKKLVPILREVYSSKIVVGGVQATISAHDVLKENELDIVVRGEGDRTIADVARAIDSGDGFEKVTGISYSKEGNIYDNEDSPMISDLDTLPFPARHLVNMDAYRWKYWGIRVWGMMAGRGCPFRCYYCSKLFGDKVRIRSPERVVEEIEFLINKYSVKGFLFHDDTFTLKTDWINNFLDLIISKKIDIRFRCHTRINTASPQLLKKLYLAGCRGVDFGIESGDPRISKIIKKAIDLEKVKEVVAWARDANLEVMGNFMVGFPDDTHYSIRKNVLFASGIPFSFINVSIVTPYPGTLLYDTLPFQEKNKFDFSRFRQSASEFSCQPYDEYNSVYTIPNVNLSRREILHYYQLMPIYFFSKRAEHELLNFLSNACKLIYLWGIKRNSFKESLAPAFPSTRSMILAIGRAFKKKRGFGKLSFLRKLIKVILFKDRYLCLKQSVFEA